MQIYEQFFFKDQCSANLSLFCTIWFIGVCEWQQSLIIRVPVCLFAHKKYYILGHVVFMIIIIIIYMYGF